MENKDYEQKKRECLDEFCKRYRIEEPSEQNIESFGWTFDRAFTLGREKETISQEDIEKGAREAVRKEYLCESCAWKDDCDLFGSKCLPDNVDSLEPLGPKANSDYTQIPEKTFVSEWDKSEPSPKSVSEISEEISDRVADTIKSEFDKIEPKPAEPNYNVGDKVIFKCSDGDVIQTINSCKYKMGGWFYNFAEGGAFFDDGFFEPYTEPTETCTDDCKSQCKSQEFDAILKDSFSKERRLNIATQIMASIVGDDWSNYRGSDDQEIRIKIAKESLRFADALIAEAEKGGDDGNQ